jgi:hypothetical protein
VFGEAVVFEVPQGVLHSVREFVECRFLQGSADSEVGPSIVCFVEELHASTDVLHVLELLLVERVVFERLTGELEVVVVHPLPVRLRVGVEEIVGLRVILHVGELTERAGLVNEINAIHYVVVAVIVRNAVANLFIIATTVVTAAEYTETT